MRKRDERFGLMKRVVREYRTAFVAVELLGDRLRADPSALRPHELKHRDYLHLRTNLEATYLIRLFAEFETGLRDAWRHAYGRRSHPRTRDLLQAFAARCVIPPDRQERADQVREYRNSMVHEHVPDAPQFTFDDAREHLFRFFSRIPPNW